LFHLGTSHPSCRARANFKPCLRVVDKDAKLEKCCRVFHISIRWL
jgi:hypothetical protein